ncbi:MAG: pseudouridine-5'-phosphate glycosidase [Phycisphaerales bacterium]|nr:pseudouridine-5'-phosphate glycosidase [Phycisphaerales bacterium]
MNRAAVRTSPEVQSAIAASKPVVALETAVLTHGLPRTPLATPKCFAEGSPLPGIIGLDLEWDEAVPANQQLGSMLARVVEHAGAVPAFVGVLDGVLHVGLDEEQRTRLGADESAEKASTRDLAALISLGRNAGTTVAATLRACRLAQPAPIRVFATGGIGGVHRDWQKRPDISADLKALANEPVAVIASGAKVILDLPATAEALDALGVPLIGYQTDNLPRFTAAAGQELPVSQRADDPETIASICALHWDMIGSNAAILVANPCPAGLESDVADIDRLVNTGLAEAAALGIEGGDVTPFLLGAMGRDPDASTISANMALLLGNAMVASRISLALVNAPDNPS